MNPTPQFRLDGNVLTCPRCGAETRLEPRPGALDEAKATHRCHSSGGRWS